MMGLVIAIRQLLGRYVARPKPAGWDLCDECGGNGWVGYGPRVFRCPGLCNGSGIVRSPPLRGSEPVGYLVDELDEWRGDDSTSM